MPCYSMRTTEVLFGENTNLDALFSALKELFPETQLTLHKATRRILSADSSVEFDNGILAITQSRRGQKRTPENVKAGYAKHVLINNARRAGWSLTGQNNQNRTSGYAG